MALALVYTSVPKGLKPGTYGFCTVACSRKLPEHTVSTLEQLSGYRRASSDPDGVNPVVYSYLFVEDCGTTRRVLSRVGDAGADYSGRANKIACHFVLERDDMGAAGPARLFDEKGLFVERWNDEPKYFENAIRLPSPKPSSVRLEEWERATGDSGWAGVLAATACTGQPVCLIVSSKHNALRLYQEALDLVPVDRRWNATFSTYYTKTSPGVQCQWKAALQGSPEESTLRSIKNALLVDLTRPEKLPSADAIAKTELETKFIAAARSNRPAPPLEPFASTLARDPESRDCGKARSDFAAPPPPPERPTPPAPPEMEPVVAPPLPTSSPAVFLTERFGKRNGGRKRNGGSAAAKRRLLWLSLGAFSALVAVSASLVVMACFGRGPLKNVVSPEQTARQPVEDQAIRPTEKPDGDDGIGEDLTDPFDAESSDDFDPFSFKEDEKKAPPSKRTNRVDKTSGGKRFIPRDWEESGDEIDDEEDENPFEAKPLKKARVDVESREFKRVRDFMGLVDEGGFRVDFNVDSSASLPSLRHDATDDVKTAFRDVYRFCKDREGTIAVSCNLKADVAKTRRFKKDASARAETQTLDFGKKAAPSILKFEVVSPDDLQTDWLQIQFNESSEYAGLLSVEASSERARAYFLSCARLKWTITVPGRDNLSLARVFESKETQLFKPRSFNEREKVLLTPFYDLASELGESRPDLVDEDSLINSRKKYAIVIAPDKSDSKIVDGTSEIAKTVDFVYSLETPYSDSIEFMTIRFGKTRNSKYLEFQKFYDKDELTSNLTDYYYDRVREQLDRKSRASGSLLSPANPDEVDRNVAQSVRQAVRKAEEFVKSPRRFEFYLAPTNVENVSLRRTPRDDWILLGSLEIADGTETTPYPKRRQQ